jgi:anti-repressor protein
MDSDMADTALTTTAPDGAPFPVVREVDIGGHPAMGVDARALHGFLGSATAFKDWIARRIVDYDFLDGSDFCSFLSESGGGRPSKEYTLTLDMAKEVAMVDRSERGKQVRRYFIECEKRVHQAPALDLNDLPSLQAHALALTNKVIEQHHTIDRLEGELGAVTGELDRIANADGSMCITDAAKTLQMRPKDLFSYLSQNGWIYKRPGNANYLGYQSRLVSGLLEHKVTTVLRADGSEKVTEQVRVTAKGIVKLAALVPPAVGAA